MLEKRPKLKAVDKAITELEPVGAFQSPELLPRNTAASPTQRFPSHPQGKAGNALSLPLRGE
jgi:hypothetical protein